MANQELATAYVTIVPTLRGAVAQIKQQLTGAGTSLGDQLGREMSSGLGKSLNFQAAAAKLKSISGGLQTVGEGLSKYITKPATVAASAIGGLVLAAGFKRITGIENATQSLKGLGLSAQQAGDLMKNAVLPAVKGTAFGMAEAGSAAAGAFAAGITSTDQLQRHLRIVGDAAAQSGAEFGHVARMLNDVAAAGYVSGENLMQLTENGIYAVPMLAKYLGVTTTEVKKLASEGKISAEQLSAALEQNIGGSALAMGETLTGTLKNVNSALGRLGEKVLSDVMPQIKAAASQLITLLDSEQVSRLATQLGGLLAGAFSKLVSLIEGAVRWWDGLSGSAQKFVGIAAGVAVALGPVLLIFSKIVSGVSGVVGAFGKLASIGKGSKAAGDAAKAAGDAVAVAGSKAAASGGKFDKFGSAVGKVGGFLRGFGGPLLAIVGTLAKLALSTPGVQQALGNLFQSIAPALSSVSGTIGSVLGGLLSKLQPMFETVGSTLGNVFQRLAPVIGNVVGTLGSVFQQLAPVIGSVLGTLGQAFGSLLQVLAPIGAQLLGMLLPAFQQIAAAFAPVGQTLITALLPAIMQLGQAFGQVLTQLAPLIPLLVGGLLGVVVQLVTALAPLIVQLVSQLAPVLVQVMSAVLPLVTMLITQLVPVIAQIVAAIAPLVVMLISQLLPVFTQIMAALMPLITALITQLVPVFAQIIAAIMPLVMQIIPILIAAFQGILNIVTTVFTALAPIINAALMIVTAIIQTVTALIKGDWEAVWNGILAILQGVWDFICSVVQGAINIVSSVIQNVLSFIGSLWNSVWQGISDFFSTIWEAIVSAGEGFFNSVGDTFNSVMDFIGGIPDKIMGFFAGIGTWLIDSGRALIDGFLDGIKNAFEGAKNFVSDMLGGIRDLFPFSPAKEGPFSGKGWVLYSGQSVGETFTGAVVDSLKAGLSAIGKQLAGVQEEFAGLSTPSPALRLGALAGVPENAQLAIDAEKVQAVFYDTDGVLIGSIDGRIRAAGAGGRARALDDVLGVRR